MGNGVFGVNNEAETEVQKSWEIQNSLSKQEQQPQTQFNMIGNQFQHNNHSDLLQIHSYKQNEQSHYMPNQDKNGHFMLENGPLKPFAAPNLPAGNIQQQIESVIEILSDPDEYNMRLAGTNFHTFLNILTYYAGGNEAQKYLLSKQIAELQI